jgi:hypothetical protein
MRFLIRIAFLFITAIFVTSCGNTANQKSQSNLDTPSPVDMANVTTVAPLIVNTDAALRAQVKNLYSDYLEMQSALAGDKFNDATAAAKRLTTHIDSFKNSTPPENQKQAYDTHIIAIRKSASCIANSKDIKQQRIAFEPLSVQVFELLKSFGSDKPVYQAHCPMAFDNKGASWLSDKAIVRNPYFGDKMLECGEVITVIKK